MRGIISGVMTHPNGAQYGFVTGEDGKSYYFDERDLAGRRIMKDLKEKDEVEFKPSPPFGIHKRGIAMDIIVIQIDNSGSVSEERDNRALAVENNNSGHENHGEIIKFFKEGFAKHLDKEYAYDKYLKNGSGQDEVIDKLSKLLYISKIGHHILDYSSKYQFCLIGTTSFMKQYIRGMYEFLLVFSHFDGGDWQQKTLIVEREIRKRREIADRRPLVNFYVLISNATELKQEINKVKGGTHAAIVPFTFTEILSCKTSEELSVLLIERFGEYLFENNMLGETTAIDDDSLLFGDRGKIADSIVYRCQNSNNSGIFGLRRSGKSSVLNAVLRRLEREGIKYIRVEARSDLENLQSWKTALFDIAKKVRQATLLIEQRSNETRSEFIDRLSLNSKEDDYQTRPSQYFVEDIKLYCKDEPVFVIALDEVELITFNTAKTSAWKNVEAFCGFWGALRDCGCALVISGVNSTINEMNSISFNGIHGDNPMYGRIINCADSSSTYLPVFTDEQTKSMINTLGGFSNIAFSNVYSEINRAFGGQPFAIRQFCSYVFEKVKSYRKPNQVYEVSKATVENMLVEFGSSAAGNNLCEIILQHLTIFKDEYEMLKRLALAPDRYRTIEEKNIMQIDHLQKYGLIEYDYTTKYVTFRIQSIKAYICRNSNKDPMDMSNEERRQYVLGRVAECEIKLKTYIRDYYVYSNTEPVFRRIIYKHISSKSSTIRLNHKAIPAPDPNTCPFNDLFDHKKFILYFSSLKTIIQENWATLGQKLETVNIKRAKFSTCMDDLNAGRTDAAHYDAADKSTYPDVWDIDDHTMQSFIVAFNTLSGFFKECNL